MATDALKRMLPRTRDDLVGIHNCAVEIEHDGLELTHDAVFSCVCCISVCTAFSAAAEAFADRLGFLCLFMRGR
jgi:hypothetical protein